MSLILTISMCFPKRKAVLVMKDTKSRLLSRLIKILKRVHSKINQKALTG